MEIPHTRTHRQREREGQFLSSALSQMTRAYQDVTSLSHKESDPTDTQKIQTHNTIDRGLILYTTDTQKIQTDKTIERGLILYTTDIQKIQTHNTTERGLILYTTDAHTHLLRNKQPPQTHNPCTHITHNTSTISLSLTHTHLQAIEYKSVSLSAGQSLFPSDSKATEDMEKLFNP